jgi:photosystem II stability/assembly factor-like uncharacterized protein
MKNKAKYLLEAVVTIAILMAFVMPGAAITPKAQLVNPKAQNQRALSTRGEWIEQASGFAANQGVRSLDAVNATIAWAVGRDGTTSDVPTTEFTRTTDGGSNWIASFVTTSTDPTHGIGNICALTESVAYVSVYNHVGSQDGTDGPYKTTDGGSHWTQLGHEPISFVNNVHFFNENEGVVLGDTKDGYFEDYYTSDGGVTWTRVPQANYSGPGLPSQSDEGGWTGVVDAFGSTVIFGTNYGKLYISQDKGHTYYASNTGISHSDPGTNTGVNEIAFKDATHGIVGHSTDSGDFTLYETSDGGVTWAPVTHTGYAYDYDIAYVPGTTNMYVSTGATYTTGVYGASYTLDGGHTWTDYPEVTGSNATQLMATDFVDNKIGWAGAYATDETTGGMFKHLPSAAPQPAFTIDITGGKGINVTVKNVGEGNATIINYNLSIVGGLFMKQRLFSGTRASLVSGASFSFTETIMGIGLGILKKPVPTITVKVTCSQGVSQVKTVSAKIFFSKVTIQ